MAFEDGFVVDTKGRTDILDITPQVERAVSKSGISSGIVLVFTPGSTAGLTTMEYEPGAISDLTDPIASIAPEVDGLRARCALGGCERLIQSFAPDCWGRASLFPCGRVGSSPATWQQIVLVDFDNLSRSRRVEVQIIGDAS